MRVLEKRGQTSNFVPDYLASSLQDIDFAMLQKRGVRYIAFDADSTLVPFRGTKLDAATKKFLCGQRSLFKGWCIATNRPINNLLPLGKNIEARVIQAGVRTRKPRRKFFEQIIKMFDAKPEQIAMIGDKLFADVWGANRAGLVTVWVEHIGPDSPWDRLLRTRPREQRLLKKYATP